MIYRHTSRRLREAVHRRAEICLPSNGKPVERTARPMTCDALRSFRLVATLAGMCCLIGQVSAAAANPVEADYLFGGAEACMRPANHDPSAETFVFSRGPYDFRAPVTAIPERYVRRIRDGKLDYPNFNFTTSRYLKTGDITAIFKSRDADEIFQIVFGYAQRYIGDASREEKLKGRFLEERDFVFDIELMDSRDKKKEVYIARFAEYVLFIECYKIGMWVGNIEPCDAEFYPDGALSVNYSYERVWLPQWRALHDRVLSMLACWELDGRSR